MGQKNLQNLHEEFKLFGIWKIYSYNQSFVTYQHDIKDEEIADEILLHEKINKQK